MSPLQKKFHRLIRATGVFDARLYLSHSPDVERVGMDPLEHYIVAGETEGRAPNAFFDPAWYRKQAPKVAADHCLLAHYLTVGDADGLQPMVGFDPVHVHSQVPGRKEPALVLFLSERASGRHLNPNRVFDYDWYLDSNPDVASAGIDGYYHFVHVGADEGRTPSREFSWYYLRERFNLSGTNSEVFRQLMLRWRILDLDAADGEPSVAILQDHIRSNHRPSPLHEPLAPPSASASRRKCDVYAFYLTQYHRIPENDAWWGEGFTEWHNVVRGVPRFAGHYQPRIPSALGFYDLTDPRIMREQVALAKQAGLAGFAFYYYNFGTQRLLERPLEQFLADSSLDAGYFLIWANETWSRRWDGSESEILLEQTYPETLASDLAEDLVRHFADQRYRRIDGRPLFVVYRSASLPETAEWVENLRKEFKRRGSDPLIYMAQTFEDEDPTEYGLDGALEFPPHKHSRTLSLTIPERVFVANSSLRVWDYEAFIAAARNEPPAAYPLIRTCFPSWDNDSRRQGASSIVHGSTPGKFGEWLSLLVETAEADPMQPDIVCINAWNEWGEGAYLEPDRHFGYAYLNKVQSVLYPLPKSRFSKVLLVGHDAFPAGAQRLLLNLGRTLKHQFGRDVAFLLLRADAGYDGLLDEYRAVAETKVVENNAKELLADLSGRGFSQAIVNSSASAAALPMAAAAEIDQILLVHELPGIMEKLGAAPLLKTATQQVRRFISPSPTISAMLFDAGVQLDCIRLLPQGQYRKIGSFRREEARNTFLKPTETEHKLVLGLGFADTRKGADLFVGAAEAAAKAGEQLKFIWQGNWDPEVYSALEKRIHALEASGHVELLPNSENIELVFSAADVFILPSREDPLPSVAIEAWSVGLPVVALAGGGGVSDLIAGEPRLGRLADEADGETLLRNVVAAARPTSDREFRISWAVERFSWPSYVRRLLHELQPFPTLDVVIIGHNHGSYAEARIDSLLRQTAVPASISYQDMASTDGSEIVARAVCQKAGLDFSAEPSNDGRLFATWLELARRSDATYFHIAEGDDTISPTMFERCIDVLEAFPDAAYAFVGVEWIDEQGAIIADHVGYPAAVIGEDLLQGGQISAERLLSSGLLIKNPVLSISSVVWRRDVLVSLLENNNPLMRKLEFAFDWMLYLCAARAGYAAVYLAEPLCRHRQHLTSFAARDDLQRHREEIRTIYSLAPAPEAAQARREYLDTLV